MSPPGDQAAATDFRALASRITRTRNDFRRVYEQVQSGVPGARSFITVVGGATSDQVAFERALRQANEEGWFSELAERLFHDDFFPDKSEAVTNLQAVLSVPLGFIDASTVERGGLRARGRLCKVEVASGGNPQAITGTGFLVGPSTVLTAFHVVESLVDAQSNGPLPGSDRQLCIRFDHATGRRDAVVYKVPESWLAASSRPHPAEISNAQGAPEVVATPANVDLSGFLDYAVIWVAGSPGSERGFYDFAKAVEPAVGGMIHLFQHPLGVKQVEADGVFTGFRGAANKERIDHTANAEGGSSGGLLLDGSYALVGLHQGSYGKPVVNTGISALAIRDHVQTLGVDLLDSRYVVAFRLADDSRPILGRKQCQEWIRRGSNKLVRVKPLGSGKGVSFTLEIMQACLPQTDHVIGHVPVLQLDSDAIRTAATLLDRLGVDATDLPTEAGADSSQGSWIGQLAATFAARVEQSHTGRVVWLLIDDLEKKEHTIPDGSVREFLSELYKQSSNFKNLRIVLLGLTDFPSGFPTGRVDNEDLAPPQTEDIVSYVRLRLTAGGIDHSAAEVERFAALIREAGGIDVQPLSDFVAEKVDHVLNEAIGGGP